MSVRGYLVTNDGSLVYELEEEETCIGRAEGNDIVLTASRSISSRHCRLVIKSSGGRTQARMYDLESLNGTFLNDTHICNSHAELRSGDSLRLGYDPTIYRFYLAGEAPADLLGPTAAPPRSSSAAGSPSHGRTAAGRSTNWEGSGAGRSPLKDYERGGGGGGRGRAGDRSTYVSPDRLPPAGVTSEQTGARRRSLTGMSPSSIRARDSMGVGGTLGMGGGRYREPEFDPDSPQGRMAARRRSLSAARAGGGGVSSSSSPWEGTGRPSISPTLRRSSSAAPSRSHQHPPHPPSHQAAAGRSTSGGGGGGGGRGWSSTHSPPSSGLKPREKPFSVGYPSATSGGHRRVEEEGGGGGGGGRGGGQPPRHGSSSSSSSDGGGHSHIQPKRVTPWHVVDEERRRGGGGDHVQEVEPPFARDEDEDRRGGDGGGYYDRDGGGRQGEEEDEREREREREEEGEMERERDRAPPPPPQTPQNLKVVGPVSITMAQNGDVESALDSRGEDIRGRGVGGGATPLARSRRPSSASLSITAIGPVTVNPPPAPFTPQQPPVQASTSSSSTAPGGASLQRTAALLASMASEPPLAHSPTLDAAVAASKRAAAGMGGVAGSPRGGIFTSPSGSGAAIEQLSNTIASPRVVGQNKMLASLEAMKLQAAAAAASAVVPAPPPMSIHSPRGNSGPPPPPPTTVATAALANSIHEAELSQRRAAAASAASILAAATAAAAPSSSTTYTSAPLVNPGGGGGGALPFIPPLPLSSTSSALLSRSQLSSSGGTQPLSSTSLATSRIASSMPNALEHLATSTSSRPLASRQGRDSPLRLVLDVLGEEREAVKETLSELKTMVSGRGIPQPQFQPQPPQSQSRQQQQQQQEPPPPPPAPTITPQQRSAALLLGGLLKKAVKVRLREAFDVWHQHSQVAAAEDDYRVRDELARMLEERRGAILAAVAEEERQEMEAERVRFLEAQARAREEEAAARVREEAAERARWEQTVHIDVSPSRLRTSSALRVSTPNKPGAPVYTMGPSGVMHIHPSSSSTAQQQQQQGGGGGGNAAFFPGSSTSSAFNLGGANTTTTSFSNGGGGGGGGGGAATLSMNATGGSKVSVYADGSISLGNTGGVSQPYPDPQHFLRDERGKEGGNHWADAVATIANDSREPHPVATIIGVEGGGGMGGPGGTYVRLEHSQPAPVSDSTTNTAPKKSFHECTSSRPIWEYAEGPLSTTVSSRAKTRSKSPPAVVRRNSLTALGAGGGGGKV